MLPESHAVMAPLGDRRYDLDALRAFAMLLGIALHAGLTFVPAAWIVQDSRPNPAFGLLLAVIHGFRMPLFFLISGFFTAMLLRRRGIRGLLRQRAWRILLPCLVGVATIVPLQHAVSAWASRTASQSAPDDTGTLVDAIRRGDAAAVRVRLDAGADPNAMDPAMGVTPLVWAATRGDVATAALLLERGADVNGRNRDGNTPLHGAAFLGRVAVVELLLEQGADVRAQGADGGTPMASTQVDFDTTRFISQLLQVDAGIAPELERNRDKIRALLAARLAMAGDRQEKESEGGVSPEREGLRAAYGRWLTSGRWRVSLGGWSIHLIQSPTFDHLWFLWFLCWLVPLYAVAAWGMDRLARPIPARAAMLGLVLLSLLPQWFMGIAVPTFGPDTSAGVIPMPHLLLYYGIFFAFGAIHYDAGGADVASRVSRRGWLLVSLAMVLALPAGLVTMAGGSRLLGAVSQVSYAWLMSLGLMGICRRWLGRENRTIRYLSDSSYFLYLTHLPLIIAVQAVVRDWPWPPSLKFLLIVGVVTALLLVVYDLVIRYGLIGRILNGPRTRPGRHVPVDAPVPTLNAAE